MSIFQLESDKICASEPNILKKYQQEKESLSHLYTNLKKTNHQLATLLNDCNSNKERLQKE